MELLHSFKKQLACSKSERNTFLLTYSSYEYVYSSVKFTGYRYLWYTLFFSRVSVLSFARASCLSSLSVRYKYNAVPWSSAFNPAVQEQVRIP